MLHPTSQFLIYNLLLVPVFVNVPLPTESVLHEDVMAAALLERIKVWTADNYISIQMAGFVLQKLRNELTMPCQDLT